MNIQLSDIKAGLALVLLGLAFGVVMGIWFGVNEDLFKNFIAQGIAANPDVHDANSQDKIWRYAQRAHFHATGIAAFSIGLLLLVAVSSLNQMLKKVTATLMGLGLLYPLAWLSMFFLAPSIGRDAAHSHVITELFTFTGIGCFIVGFLLLVANLFFGSLQGDGDT
jgi:hypothetical protein|tara:strand:+ start:1955 stop:2452 length:498 start_codon:yes stop_codon:yes gene_type:complete